ncbi:MAG: C-type lectin domain-containing protein [Anaerolineae bacterium]|nr:C-type lectin domain-containing protein [Anaerolineae bacterium]
MNKQRQALSHYISITLALFACLVWASGTKAEPLYHTPVYNPETKSYFELVRVAVGSSIRWAEGAEATWATSQRLASTRTHKNVRGRLAVVKTKQVNDFLRDTFKPDHAAWIGLRYYCHFNKLQWVTGETHPHSAYSNWDRVWNHAGGRDSGLGSTKCGKSADHYWPVHYWSDKGGFRWNANGPVKEWYSFFVEYPTSGE